VVSPLPDWAELRSRKLLRDSNAQSR
jgi:hypothetical protein